MQLIHKHWSNGFLFHCEMAHKYRQMNAFNPGQPIHLSTFNSHLIFCSSDNVRTKRCFSAGLNRMTHSTLIHWALGLAHNSSDVPFTLIRLCTYNIRFHKYAKFFELSVSFEHCNRSEHVHKSNAPVRWILWQSFSFSSFIFGNNFNEVRLEFKALYRLEYSEKPIKHMTKKLAATERKRAESRRDATWQTPRITFTVLWVGKSIPNAVIAFKRHGLFLSFGRTFLRLLVNTYHRVCYARISILFFSARRSYPQHNSAWTITQREKNPYANSSLWSPPCHFYHTYFFSPFGSCTVHHFHIIQLHTIAICFWWDFFLHFSFVFQLNYFVYFLMVFFSLISASFVYANCAQTFINLGWVNLHGDQKSDFERAVRRNARYFFSIFE